MKRILMLMLILVLMLAISSMTFAANEFLEVKDIARDLLPLLKSFLVFPMLINREYDEAYKGKGDTIQVEKPAVFVSDTFGGTINLQDIGEKFIPVKMQRIEDVSITVTSKDFALSSRQFRTKYLEAAALAIAEKINSAGLELYKEIPYFYGTSGDTPNELKDFAQARKILNINKVPNMDRKAVWDPEADAEFLTLDPIVNAEKSGTTEALRSGSIGNIVGFENYMSQSVRTHVAGTYTALADVTAAVTAASNALDTTSGFDYSTVVLTSAAGASTAKLKKGDLLTFNDDSDIAYQCTVLEDSAAAIAGVVTVKVIPAVANDVTDLDVTFPDVTAGAHTANLAFHPKAFAFVTAPLDQPRSKPSYVVEYEGLSLRVVEDYDTNTKDTILSMDILFGYKTMYPQLATRVLG